MAWAVQRMAQDRQQPTRAGPLSPRYGTGIGACPEEGPARRSDLVGRVSPNRGTLTILVSPSCQCAHWQVGLGRTDV